MSELTEQHAEDYQIWLIELCNYVEDLCNFKSTKELVNLAKEIDNLEDEGIGDWGQRMLDAYEKYGCLSRKQTLCLSRAIAESHYYEPNSMSINKHK